MVQEKSIDTHVGNVCNTKKIVKDYTEKQLQHYNNRQTIKQQYDQVSEKVTMCEYLNETQKIHEYSCHALKL